VTEIELLLPEGLEPERLAAAVAGDGYAVLAMDASADRAHRVYYDTFDGRLRSAGTPAVHERGRLVLDSLGAPVTRPPERVLADDLAPGPLRDALKEVIHARALLPVAEIDVSERHMRILDADQKTIVRASIDRAEPVGCETALRPRLRLAAVRGYDAELERVCEALQRELGLERPAGSMIDEAVAAVGGTPGGFSAKVEVALELDERADEAAVAVLRRLLEVIEQNLEGTIADLDSEFLHDLRVAVRRSRSVQRQLKGVFAPRELEHFRAEFRWVQQITGDVRDLDVYLLGFEDMRALVPEALRDDLEPLREVLRRRRVYARERMVQELGSERFLRLRLDWSALLDRLVSLPENDRPDAARPIGGLAGHRVAKVYRRIVKDGEAIDRHGPSEPFHELRKRCKELRYLLELFASSLYPPDVVKPMIKTLKGLQDVLGRHQDREVQIATLSALATELAAEPGSLLATGALIARLDEDKSAARAQFADRFGAFASHQQRVLVRETFS
jgi:CHAD domain-containing protein